MKIGEIYKTKDDHKIEILDVIDDADGGTTKIKTFVHQDSQNMKQYSWKHNEKYFIGWCRIKDLQRKLDSNGYKLVC